LHPFYVFQIASIILWSIDNYWYYGKYFYRTTSRVQQLDYEWSHSDMYRHHINSEHHYNFSGNQEGMFYVSIFALAAGVHSISIRRLNA